MNTAVPDMAWLFFAGLALFWVGLLGLFVRRSLVGMLIGLGFAWSAIVLTAIAFALATRDPDPAAVGGAIALSAAIVGCLEVAVGLALVTARVRRRGSIDAEEARLLEG